MGTLRKILVFTTLAALCMPAQAPDPRMAEILAKRARGEQPTPKEMEYVKGVIARRTAEFVKTHPPRESTGLTPLPDLGGKTYQGEQGGLYPGGANVPP